MEDICHAWDLSWSVCLARPDYGRVGPAGEGVCSDIFFSRDMADFKHVRHGFKFKIEKTGIRLLIEPLSVA